MKTAMITAIPAPVMRKKDLESLSTTRAMIMSMIRDVITEREIMFAFLSSINGEMALIGFERKGKWCC